jgi:hypothetical protein
LRFSCSVPSFGLYIEGSTEECVERHESSRDDPLFSVRTVPVFELFVTVPRETNELIDEFEDIGISLCGVQREYCAFHPVGEVVSGNIVVDQMPQTRTGLGLQRGIL